MKIAETASANALAPLNTWKVMSNEKNKIKHVKKYGAIC